MHDFGPDLVSGSIIVRNGYKLINVVFPFWYFKVSDMLQDNKMTTICPIYSIIENKSENAYVLKFWMTILVPGWSRVDFFLRNRYEGLDGVYWLENNGHFLILIRE